MIVAALHDRDEAQIMGEYIDIVVRRQRDGDLELTRQIGAAEDRLVFLHTAGDLLLVDPDLVPRSAMRQQMVRDVAGEVLMTACRSRRHGSAGGENVAVDVAAGGDGIQHVVVQALHQRLQVALHNAVELHGFPRRQPDGAVGAFPRQLLDAEPLLRRQDAGGDPHPRHEDEGFFHALLAAFGAQVAVVLLVDAVEFRQLLIVVRQRAGFDMGQSSAMVPRRRLLAA